VVLRPVGDLPTSVYWVRRLLLLLVVVVVVALGWWLLPFGGDGDTTTPTSAPSVSPTPTPSKTKSPKPTPSETPTKTAAAAPECPDSAITVTVETDRDTYAAGRSPSFTFAVENVSKETCTRDVGPAANELLVTSGGAQIWSSDDCNPGGAPDLAQLDPEDRFVQTFSWPREESQPGCPSPQETAPPGTYQVVARNLEILSEPAAFVLE
jgi:hypothetical protein